MNETIFVTGGAGFIGSNFVLDWIRLMGTKVVNLDKLTYAGNLQNLVSLAHDERHVFAQGDILDRAWVMNLFRLHQPRAIIHFAAESHVDRSIAGPEVFIQTNVVGSFNLLEEARQYWESLDLSDRQQFRFVHVSTDEVYGSLGPDDPPFTEKTPYAPNSPYSASKAGSDHLARSFFHTYGLPVIITNCSNNYGPFQFPEKLIPLVIHHALMGKPLPVYGLGSNIRDWLYVADHCHALRVVLAHGKPGEVYNIGGRNEKTNLEVVTGVCSLLDGCYPQARPEGGYASLISFVKDRAGHDMRYAIDADRIERDLGWKPLESFETGIMKTVQWYLAHVDWLEDCASGHYRDFNLNTM
ncbi:MAG: dTDP-glucose 4,6-dehydratase [Pseudomonadota bacterium]|nr:dTDP-glucose 4,6-dehydratase [Pseudomonadota bacterium]